MVQPLWKTVLTVPQKVKHRTAKQPSNFTSRYITKELETVLNIYRPMLIAALFTIAKGWKETICPPTDERINKR